MNLPFSDVELNVRGVIFKLHRYTLSSSLYFKTLFTIQNFKESGKNKFSIEEDPKTFLQFIKTFYDNSNDNIIITADVLILADKYQCSQRHIADLWRMYYKNITSILNLIPILNYIPSFIPFIKSYRYDKVYGLECIYLEESLGIRTNITRHYNQNIEYLEDHMIQWLLSKDLYKTIELYTQIENVEELHDDLRKLWKINNKDVKYLDNIFLQYV